MSLLLLDLAAPSEPSIIVGSGSTVKNDGFVQASMRIPANWLRRTSR